jgi:hypothetical protein
VNNRWTSRCPVSLVRTSRPAGGWPDEMMAQQAQQQIERNISYFFSATVTVNEYEEHAIFDIRWRKNPADGSMQFYSSDIPPVPVKPNTLVRAVFYVENSIGVTPVKYKLGEVQFSGSSIEIQSANPHNISNSSKSELTLVVMMSVTVSSLSLTSFSRLQMNLLNGIFSRKQNLQRRETGCSVVRVISSRDLPYSLLFLDLSMKIPYAHVRRFFQAAVPS